MFERYFLPNNTEVVLVPQQDTRSITVLIMYPVGSRYESDKMQGVSHYIEHLMFKGTERRKNTQILTREIDRLGAEYNAFTGKEYTGYYIKTDAEYSRTALDILSDMLFHSTFDPKEMEREKPVIVEELRMYKDNPVMNIDNVFEDLMYDGSPLGRDIGGTERHVMGYKRDDVLAFKKKFYDPANMVVVVAGKIDERVKEMIGGYFCIPHGEKRKERQFQPFSLGKKHLEVQEKKTDQAQLIMGFPGFSYTAKEKTAETVMNTIFGGSMSSRLFIQIRERRGLAYVIRSGSDHFRDTGYAYVRAGLDAKNINQAITVIKQEIQKLVTKGVTRQELTDAKTHIRGALTLSLEDSSSQASWYAKQALFAKKIETPEEILAKVDEVSNADIQRVAKRIFDLKKMRLAVIGDIKKEQIQL